MFSDIRMKIDKDMWILAPLAFSVIGYFNYKNNYMFLSIDQIQTNFRK